MADRSLAKLTVLSWEGDLPLVGHHVMADRGRTAFLIVEIMKPKRSCGHVARFICERVPRDKLQADAIVHGWRWSAR